MILEAGLLTNPRSATSSDAAPTTTGQDDHAGVTVEQEGTKVPSSIHAKAHTTAMPSAQCIEAKLQANMADDMATGSV
jgi:hypothetical protein